jgi:methyl-accepting chemotaxis protein
MNIRNKMRIRTKMLVFVLITSIGVLAGVGFYIQYRTYKMVLNDAEVIAKNYSENAANEIKAELDLDLGFSRSLAHALYGYHKLDSISRDSIYFGILKNQVEQNPRYISIWMNFEYYAIRPKYTKNFGRKSVSAYMKNNESNILIEHKNLTGDNHTSGYYKAKSTNSEIVLDPYLYSFDGVNEVLVTSLCVPIRKDGSFMGLAGVDILLDKFQNNIKRINPYPNTISFLLSNNSTIIAHTNESLSGKKIQELYPDLEAEHRISQKISRGSKYSLNWNFDGIKHIVFFTPINIAGTSTPWSIGIVIPTNEIMVQARNSIISGILVAILGLIVLGVVIYYIALSITKPINDTTVVLKDLALGDIDQTKKLSINSGDELEEMATSVNQLITGLNLTENFAREIGKGNLEAEFKLLGPNDILGISLLDMQKSLLHAREFELERKAEEKKQNWETQGMALFGDILRQNSNSINEFSYNIIQNLVNFTGATLGGIYVINDNDKNHPILEMTACYAYDRRKYLEKNIETNEGLIGRCFREVKTIFMTQVPPDYIKITSGLGKERPRCLILVPLKTNDDVLGVLELAAFKVFEKHQMDFIEKVAESIASTIATVRINIRTAELLAKSQQQAEEMLAQEEEMRQNMEELQATQEEMERKRLEQEKLQEVLNQELTLLNALMQNIPDFVYFKDRNSRFLRISKSMVTLFNASKTDDLIGKSDFDFHSQDHAQMAFMEEQDIMRSLNPMVDHIVREQFDDGREQWVSTTKMPLIDGKGEVIGVWGISKIITNLKKAEIEAQEKATEASTLKQKISRCEKEFKAIVKALDTSMFVGEYTPEGLITRINEPMQNIIGLSNAEIVSKHHSEFFAIKGERKEDYKELWEDLRKGIIRQREFKGTLNGNKISLVETYSPVKDAEGKIEKIISISVRG